MKLPETLLSAAREMTVMADALEQTINKNLSKIRQAIDGGMEIIPDDQARALIESADAFEQIHAAIRMTIQNTIPRKQRRRLTHVV